MDEFKFAVLLLPVIFMIHDFEEIIFFKSWISKNKSYLKDKFPKLNRIILSKSEDLSTAAFSAVVAEEFILVSGITFLSVHFDTYYWWLAAFSGFFIHLLIHIIQWVIIRRYIPAIVTTFLALPYCLYVIKMIIDHAIFSYSEIIIWSIVGFFLTGLNLFFAIKAAYIIGNYRK